MTEPNNEFSVHVNVAKVLQNADSANPTGVPGATPVAATVEDEPEDGITRAATVSTEGLYTPETDVAVENALEAATKKVYAVDGVRPETSIIQVCW